MQHNIPELKQFLATSKNILITSHRNPDGDAVGSLLGLYHYLRQGGHVVHLVLPSEYPEFVAWMPGVEQIRIYDLHAEQVNVVLNAIDLVFCLDFNDLSRIDSLGEKIAQMPQLRVAMIDHHLDPQPFADFVLSDTSASSTCELVYDFVHLMGHPQRITPDVADCLYVGLNTDTGGFRFSNTTPKTLRTVADLLERGLDMAHINNLLYNSDYEKRLRLLGHSLANRMEILEDYHTGIIQLTRQDYEQFNIQRGDTEGIVNYLLSLKTVVLAVFITEQPSGIVKLSLRSKGDFSVQEIATKHFNGGGHRNASGGSAKSTLKATLQRIKGLLPEYEAKLAATYAAVTAN